jgi:hypothetical protein
VDLTAKARLLTHSTVDPLAQQATVPSSRRSWPVSGFHAQRYRAIATRFDKLAVRYQATTNIAVISEYLIDFLTRPR